MKPRLLISGAGPMATNIDPNMQDHYDLHTLDIDEKIKPDTVGDIRKLPFEDCSFEGILMMHVLEHVCSRDIFKTLNEAHRVLVPGGEIFISVPNIDVACEMILSGTATDTIYSVGYDVPGKGHRTEPITAMDMMYGWNLAHEVPGYNHRYGFNRDLLFKWLSQLKWSLIASHEMRLLGTYDRSEVRGYAIKEYEGDLDHEFYGPWPRNLNYEVGDVHKLIGGLHVDRYPKLKKKDENEDDVDRSGPF